MGRIIAGHGEAGIRGLQTFSERFLFQETEICAHPRWALLTPSDGLYRQ